MKCPKCGESLYSLTITPDSAVSLALGEVRRVRKCVNNHKIDTTEISRAELQSLRAMAFMSLRAPGQ